MGSRWESVQICIHNNKNKCNKTQRVYSPCLATQIGGMSGIDTERPVPFGSMYTLYIPLFHTICNREELVEVSTIAAPSLDWKRGGYRLSRSTGPVATLQEPSLTNNKCRSPTPPASFTPSFGRGTWKGPTPVNTQTCAAWSCFRFKPLLAFPIVGSLDIGQYVTGWDNVRPSVSLW